MGDGIKKVWEDEEDWFLEKKRLNLLNVTWDTYSTESKFCSLLHREHGFVGDILFRAVNARMKLFKAEQEYKDTINKLAAVHNL